MKKTIYAAIVVGLLLGIVLIDLTILKEFRSYVKENKQIEVNKIPDLEELQYFNEHKIIINDMKELEDKDDKYLVLFYSSDCPMCIQTKEDIAAFIYYGWAENVNIYFVDIDESVNVIGENIGNDLKGQRIRSIPTLFEINKKEFKRIEGVDEIYGLLNEYIKK